MEFIKENKVTIIIVIATVLLGGIAIFTALRLFQLRQEPIAPTAPQSTPQAGDFEQPQDEAVSCEILSVTFAQETTSPTASATATASPSPSSSPTTTATATASPTPSPTQTTTPSPSPTIVAQSTSTPGPTQTLPPDVPESGIGAPAAIGIGAGILLILGALVLAI